MWLAFSVKSLPHTAHQNQDVLIARSTLLVCMHSGKCVYVCLCTPWLFSDFSVAVTCIMTDGMECPFMYLLTTCIFSPVKCLLKSFASILIGLSFILPCGILSLFEMVGPYQINGLQFFLPLLWFTFLCS